MKNFFTISEASNIVNMSAETLRHYYCIGLVRPSYKDDFSKYRYYSEQKMIRLRTVKLLKYMDYEKKIGDKTDTEFIRIMPERVILLSHNIGYPNLKDLWNYHEGFYAQLNNKQREDF